MEPLKTRFNFSEKQAEEIIKIKKWLEENNGSLSRNCIVSDVKYYKDEFDNFYCSYYTDSWGTGEMSCGWIYFGIDKEGKVNRYDRNYPKDIIIIDKFDEFEKLTL